MSGFICYSSLQVLGTFCGKKDHRVNEGRSLQSTYVIIIELRTFPLRTVVESLIF